MTLASRLCSCDSEFKLPRDRCPIHGELGKAKWDQLEARIADLSKRLAAEEEDHLETLAERDRIHDVADDLAFALGGGIEHIGEHSSSNCPWQNALDNQGEIARAEERGLERGRRESSPPVGNLHARIERLVKEWDESTIGDVLPGLVDQVRSLLADESGGGEDFRRQVVMMVAAILIDLDEPVTGDGRTVTCLASSEELEGWFDRAEKALEEANGPDWWACSLSELNARHFPPSALSDGTGDGADTKTEEGEGRE